MFAIEGLDEEQCGPLAGVEVGDTVLISRYPRDDGGVSGYNEDGHQQDDDRASQASGEVEGEDEIDLYVGVEAEVFCAAHNNIPESNSEHQRTVELEMDQDTQMTAYSSEEQLYAYPDSAPSEAASADENDDDDDDEGILAAARSPIPDVSPHKLYVVFEITRDIDDTICELRLYNLQYKVKPGNRDINGYSIYGRDVRLEGIFSGASHLIPLDETTNISTITENETHHYDFTLNPSGEILRRCLHNNRCPAQCNEGRVPTQADMHAMVTNPPIMVAEHSPVCLVCIGTPLMQEYQSLCGRLENASFVDFGTLVQFYGRLNQHREELDYDFEELDERSWVYLFDDMDADSNSGESQTDNGNWEFLAEARDPNTNIPLRPAAKAAIAALPWEPFRSYHRSGQGMRCHFCLDEFEDEDVVAELPCGHAFDGECLESWLRRDSRCPTCRFWLPVEGERRGVGAAVVAEEEVHAQDYIVWEAQGQAVISQHRDISDDAREDVEMDEVEEEPLNPSEQSGDQSA